MAKRSSGFRSKTRRKLKGIKKKLTIAERLKTFKVGDKVILKLNSSVQKGMPHPRYYGKAGSITGRRGDSYIVQIKDGEKIKVIISKPEHMKSL